MAAVDGVVEMVKLFYRKLRSGYLRKSVGRASSTFRIIRHKRQCNTELNEGVSCVFAWLLFCNTLNEHADLCLCNAYLLLMRDLCIIDIYACIAHNICEKRIVLKSD